MKFKLEIELGNDEMQTYKQIAQALDEVAEQLRNDPLNRRNIRDENGNKVGAWTIKHN